MHRTFYPLTVSAGIVGPFVGDIEGAVDGDFDGADVG